MKNFEERVSSLETELNATHKSLSASKIQCEEFKFENKGLKEEMAAINTVMNYLPLLNNCLSFNLCVYSFSVKC